MSMRAKGQQQGFTITELMIATAVFSVVLLVCTFGIMQIGNTYYKGSNLARTQQAARSVMDSLSQAVQFGGENIRSEGSTASELIPVSRTQGALCVGNTRYRYLENKETSASIVGVRVDTISGAACSYSSAGVASPAPKELLANGMRLLSLSINKVNDDYTIKLVVGTGDDQQLAAGKCQGRNGDQFCATSTLETTVQRRIK